MAGFTAQGIVLRYTNFRDYDRMLTLFTRDHGRMAISAWGARRMKNPCRPATELFTMGEYVIRQGKGPDCLVSAQIQDAHYALRTNLDVLESATAMRDMVEVALVEEMVPQPELYDLFSKCIALLCQPSPLLELLYGAFVLRTMEIVGIAPELTACVACGGEVGQDIRFSVPLGGIVCGQCHDQGVKGENILPGTHAALRQLSVWDLERLHVLKLAPPILSELGPLLTKYASYHMDRRFRSVNKGYATTRD